MAAKLSFETFVNRSNEIHHFRYKYHKETYISTKKYTIITCPIHGDFPQTPKNHMRGQGCPICGQQYAKTWRQRNYKAYLSKIDAHYPSLYSFPNIEKEYINQLSKITVICKKCGSTFRTRANDLLNGKVKCHNCYLNSLKKTYCYEDLVQLSPHNYKLEHFDGSLTKSDKCNLICPYHGAFQVSVSAILNGQGSCRKCANGRRRPIKYFKSQFDQIANGNIDADYGAYIDMSTPITFTCKICGTSFKRAPYVMLSNKFKHGLCPNCTSIKIASERRKTTEQFIHEVKLKHGADTFDTSMTEYISSDSYVTLKCNKCGRLFTIEANSLLQGHGCPYHSCRSSKAENEISDFIQNNFHLKVIRNDRSILPNHLELDIYIPHAQIAIEYNGLYWHNEFNKPNYYHLLKTKECLKKGIRLFHIFEDEWIYKKEIWKNILASYLEEKVEFPITAPFVIESIPSFDAHKFLQTNSLAVTDNFNTFYRIMDAPSKTIGILCMGANGHFQYCTSPIYKPFEGLAHVLNYINTNHVCDYPLYTYTDLRYEYPNILHKIGLKECEFELPRHYFTHFTKRITEEQYNNLSPKDTTINWSKIYDCGHMKYSL